MTDQISTGPFTLIPTVQNSLPAQPRPHSWTKNELLKYAIFMRFFEARGLLNLLNSNKWSFFRSLSIFLQRKNPNQCRILHLAMLKRHHSIQDILTHFASKYQDFFPLCDKFEPTISNIIHIFAKEQAVARQATHQSHLVGKEKEDLKPTDVDYPEEKGDEEDKNTRRSLVSQKRESWASQEEKKAEWMKAAEECQLGLMTYLKKLAVVARGF